jgi:hypothetical protein
MHGRIKCLCGPFHILKLSNFEILGGLKIKGPEATRRRVQPNLISRRKQRNIRRSTSFARTELTKQLQLIVLFPRLNDGTLTYVVDCVHQSKEKSVYLPE